jgi:hypothetical protein
MTPDYMGPCGPSFTLPQWSDFGGWDQPSNYDTVQLGKISGKPGAELLGRSSIGVWVERFDAGRGQWSMVPTNDGSVNLSLPNVDGWNKPEYYETMQTADLDGSGAAKLLVRAKDGLVTYAWDESTGHFVEVGKRPLLYVADDVPIFGGSFLRPEYYRTIQTADVLGNHKAWVLDRSREGLQTFAWDGTYWTQQGKGGFGGLEFLSDKNGFNKPEYYETIQTGDLDGTGKAVLLARAPDGLHAFRWSNGWQDVGATLTALSDANFKQPQYYRTIQTGEVTGSGKAQVLARAPDGLHTYELGPSGWSEAAPVLGLSDASGWNKPEYYETIRVASLDGGKQAMVLARSRDGIQVWRLSGGTWTQLAKNAPQLVDDPWAQPQHYRTIRTGDIDGSGRSALLARGVYGMRTFTWNQQTGSFERPVPYAQFPAFTGDDQAAAYTALGKFLLGRDTDFRKATYANPSESITEATLDRYRTQLSDRCTPLSAAVDLPEPPRFTDCSPPAGSDVSGEAWTAVSNQIIAELWAAAGSVAHFSTLDTIQTKLFQDQQGTFPAIDGALKLPPQSKSAAPTYLKLVKGGLELLGDFLGATLPKLNPFVGKSLAMTAHALGAVEAGLGLTTSPDPPQSYAAVTTKIATIQQRERDLIEAQRRYVLADYRLLMTIGSEVNGRVLTLDTTATLSAGRQSFARWIYQLYLPAFWDKFQVEFCRQSTLDGWYCQIPGGPNVRVKPGRPGYAPTDFTAILPRQGSGCVGTRFTVSCSWASPGELGNLLWQPLSKDCIYDPTPGSTAAWRYGCSIGANVNDMLDQRNGWQFPVTDCFVNLTPVGVQCGSPNVLDLATTPTRTTHATEPPTPMPIPTGDTASTTNQVGPTPTSVETAGPPR